MLIFWPLQCLFPWIFSTLREALDADPYTKQLISHLTADQSSQPGFSLAANHLYCKSRLVIPDYPELKAKIVSEAHDFPTGGHGGYLKTLKRVTAKFYWPCLKHSVKLYVQNCLICQQQKYGTLVPAGLLQPLPVPTRVWKDISLEFIKGLPSSNSYDTILVVVDRFSKYNYFLALSHPFSCKIVAALFCREIVRLHGLPRSILSDRDVVFLNAFGRSCFALVALVFE